MPRLLFQWILILTLLIVSSVCFAGAKVIMVYPSDEAELAWLIGNTGGIEEYDPVAGGYRVYLPKEAESHLIARGISYDVLIPDVKSYTRSVMGEPSAKAAKSPVVLDHYLDYAEMQTFLNDLQAAHSAIMSIETVGTTATGNHDLFLIKISDNVDQDEPEPELFFEGQIHGDELAGYILSLHSIKHLVTNYGTDPDVTAMVDGREIFFLPATNSDGAFSTIPIRYNSNGVDLNRDSGYMWHHMGGSDGPFHEPETRVIFDTWNNNQFTFHTSWHSGTVKFLYAWSCHYDNAPDYDEYEYLGSGYCSVNTEMDIWHQGAGLYGSPYHGSTKDSIYGGFGGLGWTSELTQCKICPWNTTWTAVEANLFSVLWLIEQAGTGFTGTVTDINTGNPVPAVILIDNKWPSYNDPEIGDFHRFVLPGLYNVTIWANGYEPVQLDDMTVVDGTQTDISTALTPDSDFGAWAMRWLYNFSASDEEADIRTDRALGPPDDQFQSIGFAEQYFSTTYKAYAVLDLGPGGIDDRVGDDLYIYEGHDDGDETVEVYGSTEPFPAQWDYIGECTGSCSFDLASVKLAMIRYVKLLDTHAPIAPNQGEPFDGYDLDAVGRPTIPPMADDDDDDDVDSDDDDDDDDDNDDTSDDDDDDAGDDDDDDAVADDDDDDDDGGCCG